MTKWGLGFGLAMAALIGCGDSHTVLMSGKSGDGLSMDADGGDQGGSSGSNSAGNGGKLPPDAPACLVSEVTAEIAVTNVDKVDMLFVVDNSNSMREEQAALRTQFAHLIEVLATGDTDGDGMNDFPPVKDLHLGVVSSDMGLLGIDGVDNCSGFGDDGILQHQPSQDIQGCDPSYPPFLSYVAGVNDPNKAANDFACIATLGTGGCGFEQPLESGLKALWPAMDPMAMNGMNRITFLGDANGNGTLGHGDTDNIGFVRNDPSQGLSLVAIVVVTDEEDCSSSNTRHFTPPTFLDPQDPLASQPLNLRCFFNEKDQNGDELYKIERYVNGFKALRPGSENLVVFAAITGVPPDLVDSSHVRQVDFSDQTSRDNFYASILNDQRMQEMVDPASMNGDVGTGNLLPSCNTDTGKAYPPRRIVEVAHQFGENGIVQSICQKDFGPALDAIVATVAKQLGAVCLPRQLTRNTDGLVACDVYWELPKDGQAPANTPTDCGQDGWEFLLEPDAPHVKETDHGNTICKVAQLAVQADATAGMLSFVPTKTGGQKFSQGWYYDDFSDSAKKECTGTTKQRIAFSPSAKPPTGVIVKLECSSEIPSLPTRTDIATNLDQPSLGSACDQVELNGQLLSGDAACQVRLVKPTKKWPDAIDKSMFCHPQHNVCVLACSTNDDCPAEWMCDASADTKAAAGQAICVAPSCSGGSKIASSSRVGHACVPPTIPEGGFDDREAYVATSDDESCGGGACLVYHLRGDPRPECVDGGDAVCSDPAEVEGRVYCSCRCDAPDGYAECKCPSGFSCQDVLERGGDAIAGAYCVKNGS